MKKRIDSIILGCLLVLAGVISSFILEGKNKDGINTKPATSNQSQIEKDTTIVVKENKPKVKTKLKKEKKYKSKSVLAVADSLCQEAGVPFELVKEIGQNESGWRYIANKTGGSDFGDLQVIDVTFDFWYKRLKLKNGKTRRNYLKVGIYYLKWLYDREGSWKRARFAYGRGSWRDESTWTTLEQRFMNKIDWTKYD